jgi:tripartite-type tricarboxylate transporter receptor subunit TctC
MKSVWKTVALAALAVGVVAASPALPAFADYPERPVTFIVPWPPGDLEDQLTRIIADEMTKATNNPAKVVNRPGGGGIEGASAFAASSPDGYTIGSLVIDLSTTAIIKGNAAYGRESFEPIGIFLTYPFALVAKKDAPYNNLTELAAYSKDHPVKLGHFGYDLIPTMATFVAAKKLGIKFSADAPFDNLDCASLANGDADVMNTTMALVLACLDKVKVLASYTDKRLSLFPDALMLSEQVPGLNIVLWNGLFVPKGTPQAVKDKIAAIAEAALKTDKALQVAKDTGAGIYWLNAADSAARINKEYTAAEQLVKDAAK